MTKNILILILGLTLPLGFINAQINEGWGGAHPPDITGSLTYNGITYDQFSGGCICMISVCLLPTVETDWFPYNYNYWEAEFSSSSGHSLHLVVNQGAGYPHTTGTKQTYWGPHGMHDGIYPGSGTWSGIDQNLGVAIWGIWSGDFFYDCAHGKITIENGQWAVTGSFPPGATGGGTFKGQRLWINIEGGYNENLFPCNP